MKTVKIFILVVIIACFMQACNSKSKTKPVELTGIMNNIQNIRIDRGSYMPYELNPLDKNDTINRMFYDGTKLGHWIVFQWIYPKDETPIGTAQKPVRAKWEEGYYENNKREGYWKKYRTDGIFRDSVRYRNGIGDC